MIRTVLRSHAVALIVATLCFAGISDSNAQAPPPPPVGVKPPPPPPVGTNPPPAPKPYPELAALRQQVNLKALGLARTLSEQYANALAGLERDLGAAGDAKEPDEARKKLEGQQSQAPAASTAPAPGQKK